MKKKILLAVCALTAVTAMTAGLVACNNNDKGGLSADDAAAKIAKFTGTPNTVSATFKQTFKLDVNDERPGLDRFRQDVADTVTVDIDYTAGNLYYYAKKTTKQNEVSEQLVVKEDSTYYYLTTTTVKQALADEAAAKTKIDELLAAFTRANSGYINGKAFVYSADWVHDYLLLGSGTVNGTEKSHFTYKYENAENDGLKVGIDLKYVGYFTDGGASKIGVNDTHTGATAEIVTNSKGYITSFTETMNNHLDMAIANPPFPLDYTGARSLTATYDGTITKKAAGDITQNLVPGTIVAPASVEHATVAVGDFNLTGMKFTEGTTVEVGHFVAVKVTPDSGYKVSKVTINGTEATLMGLYYCVATMPAEAGATYNVAVVVIPEGGEVATANIVCQSVEHCTIVIADFNLPNTVVDNVTTVEIGHFLAVKVTCDPGYELVSVKVNDGTEEKDITTATYGSPYCCYSIKAAGTYTVTVTVKQAN